MTRQQRKEIERQFYNYEQNRNACAEYMAERALSKLGVDYSHERVKTSPGNKTEDDVIDTVDKYETMYRWCLVYEKTLDRFRWTLKDKLMQMRYIDRNSECCILDQIGIERRTYFYWVEDILQVAFLWAQEYDLM